MFEDRDLKLDLVALALFVCVIFLSLSLCTYDVADPPVELASPLNRIYQPDVLVLPVREVTHNVCGRWGALAASVLLDAFGLGASYVLFSLAVVTVLLLMRREIESPLLRWIGWLMSLVGVTTLLTMFVPGWTPGPVIGAGGHLGVLGHSILQTYFATVGGFILAASLLIAGLMLCTDYLLLQLGLACLSFTVTRSMGTTRFGQWVATRAVRRAARVEKSNRDEETDEDELDDEYEYEEEEEEGPMTVRISGRQVHSQRDELDEDQQDDQETVDYEEDEDEEIAAEEEREGDECDDELESEEDEEDEEDDSAPGVESETTTLVRSKNGRRRLLPLRVTRQATQAAADPEEREEVMQQLDEAALCDDDPTDYVLPDLDMLALSEGFAFEAQEKEVRRKARVLEKTFASFGFDVKVVEVETGPVIAQYEVQLEAGLRLSRITGLSDDLAIALRVPSVRIVAPIPGKNTVGIEVPNEERQLVRLRDVMEESTAKMKRMRIPLFLGKDVSGKPLTVDLSSLPHLLIAGRTGTGKSVCLNAIITSILMTRRPDEVRMLMIDPKMVELSGYKTLPHLMHPVVTDMRKAEAILAWGVEKMEQRYQILAAAGVRHLSSYNQLSEEEILERLAPETDEERSAIPMHMPYIVIVADEIADLMMTAGKEVEQHIIRLAQKSRAVGIHLILATQKPTVDVITGLIKSNLPARIAFQVASRSDSRVVLDEMGADKLLGSGDMLFLSPGTSTLTRGQGTYLDDDEIDQIVDSCSQGEQKFVNELIDLKVSDGKEERRGKLESRDDLYEDAVDIVIREGRGSVSLLQRALSIGYGRAARLIDFMAEDKIVGTYAGSQAREVLVSPEQWQQMKNGDEPSPEAAPPDVNQNIISVKDWSDDDAEDESKPVKTKPVKTKPVKTKPKTKTKTKTKTKARTKARKSRNAAASLALAHVDDPESIDEFETLTVNKGAVAHVDDPLDDAVGRDAEVAAGELEDGPADDEELLAEDEYVYEDDEADDEKDEDQGDEAEVDEGEAEGEEDDDEYEYVYEDEIEGEDYDDEEYEYADDEEEEDSLVPEAEGAEDYDDEEYVYDEEEEETLEYEAESA